MLPREQVDLVRQLFEAYVKRVAEALSQYLEVTVEASVKSVEQRVLSEFLNHPDGYACLIALETNPACGHAYFGLSKEFVFSALDVLTGATQATPMGERTVSTEIERHILAECFGVLGSHLQTAWSAMEVKFELASVAGGELSLTSSDADLMVVMHAVLNLGEQETNVHLGIPGLLVRVAAARSATPGSRQVTINPDQLGALQAARCRVEALLNGSTLLMRDLLAMESGQILMLGQPSGSSFECNVNGRLLFRGALTNNGERQALQIHSVV